MVRLFDELSQQKSRLPSLMPLERASWKAGPYALLLPERQV
jgi:hypothetical protein